MRARYWIRETGAPPKSEFGSVNGLSNSVR